MTSKRYTRYDETGRITGTGKAVNAAEQNGGLVFVGAEFDGNEYWMDTGVPTLRPDAPEVTVSAASVAADGEAAILLLGLPAGARVWLDGAEHIAEGGDIELTTNLVGENIVIIDPFPAKSCEVSFLGTAPE